MVSQAEGPPLREQAGRDGKRREKVKADNSMVCDVLTRCLENVPYSSVMAYSEVSSKNLNCVKVNLGLLRQRRVTAVQQGRSDEATSLHRDIHVEQVSFVYCQLHLESLDIEDILCTWRKPSIYIFLPPVTLIVWPET